MYNRLWCLVLILPLFCVSVLPAQDDNKKLSKEDIILKKLDELQKTLESIDKDLRKEVEKNKKDIEDVKKDVDAIKRDLAALKEALTSKKETNGSKLKTFKVDEKRQIHRLDREDEDDDIYDLRDVRDVRRAPPRVTVRYNPPQVEYGKVRIINTYHLDQTVIVNGEEYTVKSGETYTVNYVAPGEFTYRVIGIHNNTLTRRITANEVFTVRIFPKQPAPAPKNYSPYYVCP